jgi:hypothetical protein
MCFVGFYLFGIDDENVHTIHMPSEPYLGGRAVELEYILLPVQICSQRRMCHRPVISYPTFNFNIPYVT